MGKNKVGPRHSTSLKLAMKRMLESGALVKPKGVGLAGSFKLAKPEKKPVVKKPAAKKTSPKKPAKKVVKKIAQKSGKENHQGRKEKVKKPVDRCFIMLLFTCGLFA